MPEVIAVTSFDHNGKRSRGTVFKASQREAEQLIKAGLVKMKPVKSEPVAEKKPKRAAKAKDEDAGKQAEQ